ncbi:hypothetical protein [Pseudomonas sp. G(2018)]|uniref:hypothetical protein n=1 Tax=Pseudomonas sp. G(2018) TaxID=2502242 RepID=UPI0010F7C798|nr:hypothetical protein [Pseudomonas sp. G(2018)]
MDQDSCSKARRKPGICGCPVKKLWGKTGRRESVSAQGWSGTLTPLGSAGKYRCITSPVLFF